MPVAIKVENVSKAYQLGEFSSGTLSRDLERWWALYRGKEDPFLKIGEANDRAVKGSSDIVWSLKDLNFEINQGDAVGIIGKNGAGKSTLLKVLSQVTTPTTGKIKVKGRIASLLEVGTGFHPELTGRENIYLNGAILGMRKSEISRKLDEIIDFSGVERYIDTPVKRYSSGMYVRLAFAVAAHLESETLIVDEVLAVGDSEFQKKCLGKMGEVSKGEGRTVLFVSHNMSAINILCSKAFLIESGTLTFAGTVEEGVRTYLNQNIISNSIIKRKNTRNMSFFIEEYFISDFSGNLKYSITNNEKLFLNMKVHTFEEFKNCHLVYELINNEGLVIFTSSIVDNNRFTLSQWEIGSHEIIAEIPINFLKEGTYSIQIRSAIPNVQGMDEPDEVLIFHLQDIASIIAKSGEGRRGIIIYEDINWKKNILI